jgi:hypothetical protein
MVESKGNEVEAESKLEGIGQYKYKMSHEL